MTSSLEPLVSDLVRWCATRPRTYHETLEAWRTTCPRLTVWEEAQERGLVETRRGESGLEVVVTKAGLGWLGAPLVRQPFATPPPVAEARRR